MGQKVNPNGFRLGVIRTWASTWYAKGRKYRELFLQDELIKRYINETLKDAGISELLIERGKRVKVSIVTSKPGVIIGKGGSAIDELKAKLTKQFHVQFDVDIQEVRSPDSDAVNIAESIQGQIERRMPYRRAAKMAIEKAMQAGALGIKVSVSGRLNGAEIARSEYFKEGNIPLQTLRANIQFATRHAVTKFGTIGVQVWVFKGLVFKNIKQMNTAGMHQAPQEQKTRQHPR